MVCFLVLGQRGPTVVKTRSRSAISTGTVGTRASSSDRKLSLSDGDFNRRGLAARSRVSAWLSRRACIGVPVEAKSG